MGHWSNLLSVGFGKVASFRFPQVLQKGINALYVKAFGINLQEFENSSAYRSLNDLFTRQLKQERAFDPSSKSIISPCDAKINACGGLEEGTELQIKGETYDVERLLGGSLEEGQWSYVNFYLSPRDYHRYHLPCGGEIQSATMIEGKLWPVNRFFMERVESIYSKNARVVLKGKDIRGKIFYLVFIGALNVGEIIFHKNFTTLPWHMDKGDELGYFKMGSSIILLMQDYQLSVEEESAVKFGNIIAKLD